LRRKPDVALATPSEAFASFAEWQEYIAENRDQLDAQFARQLGLQQWPTPNFRAYCACCGRESDFPLPAFASGESLNFREALLCPECHLNSRQRAALGLLRDRIATVDARIYLTEQATYGRVWLRRRYRRSIGSEFRVGRERRVALEKWLRKQGITEWLAHQDVTALTYPTASFDAIASFDVLEHVPDYRRALSEFARCLKPGGTLVLTVPFMEGSATTQVRAQVLADGTIEHLLPEEIHGDPISGGVLCFYNFGWDLLDHLREAGFAHAAWHRSWSQELALFGMWTLVARR